MLRKTKSTFRSFLKFTLYRRVLVSYFWAKSIIVDYNHIKNKILTKDTNVLFLCKGNICRSPFAECYLDDIGIDGIQSAGFKAKNNDRSPPKAINVAKAFDVDLENHSPQQADEEIISDSDIVFIMDISNYMELKETYPQKLNNVYLLGLFDQSYSYPIIPDPFGGSEEDFLNTYSRISSIIDWLFSKKSNSTN
jgi:protein-tyrosine phosphatase